MTPADGLHACVADRPLRDRPRAVSAIGAISIAWRRLALSLPLALSVPFAHAQAPADQAPLWDVGFGAGWGSIDNYVGSAQKTVATLPFPYVVYRGPGFFVGSRGVRGKLYENGRLSIDVGLSLNVPVDSSENAARRCLLPAQPEMSRPVCMPDLNLVLQAGPSFHYLLLEDDTHFLSLRLPLRFASETDFSSFNGIGEVANPHLYYRFRQSGNDRGWSWATQVGALYQRRAFNHFYYGVDPARAVAGMRPAYAPSSGFSGWRLSTRLSYKSRNWIMFGFARYLSLSDAVFARSPLVQRGHSLNLGLAVTRLLWRSKTLVSRRRDESEG